MLGGTGVQYVVGCEGKKKYEIMIPEHRRIEPDLALLLGVEGVPLIGPGATI